MNKPLLFLYDLLQFYQPKSQSICRHEKQKMDCVTYYNLAKLIVVIERYYLTISSIKAP